MFSFLSWGFYTHGAFTSPPHHPCPLPRPLQSFSDQAMPLRWQCPVASTTRVYMTKSDVYSFGVTLWEIFSEGGTPFSELVAAEVTAAVLAGHRLKRPSVAVDDHVMDLMRECTRVPDVGLRPSMAVVAGRLLHLLQQYCQGQGYADMRVTTTLPSKQLDDRAEAAWRAASTSETTL